MPKLVKYEKDNCQPCALVSQFLDNKGITYERINVFENPDQAIAAGIMSVPVTILLDDNGKKVGESIGFKQAELENLILQL